MRGSAGHPRFRTTPSGLTTLFQLDAAPPLSVNIVSILDEAPAPAASSVTFVLEGRALIAHAERLLRAVPLAQQRAAQRRGALQKRGVVALAVGWDKPGRSVDHVLNIAVEIHLVARAAMVDALMEHQRRARLTADNLANGPVLVHAARHGNGAVVAAGDHDHVAHIRLRLIRQEVADAQLHQGRRGCQFTELVDAGAVLVVAAALEARRHDGAPTALQNKVIAKQRPRL